MAAISFVSRDRRRPDRISSSSKKYITMLVDGGIDLSAEDKVGKTAVQLAKELGLSKCAKFLEDVIEQRKRPNEIGEVKSPRIKSKSCCCCSF